MVAQSLAHLGLDQSRTGQQAQPQPQLVAVVFGLFKRLGLGIERNARTFHH
jgi:hypothetical protein